MKRPAAALPRPFVAVDIVALTVEEGALRVALHRRPEAPAKGAAARWRIEHAQILRPADIPRFKADHVIASMQPSHAIGDMHFAPARLGEERLKGAYAWKSLLNAGAVVVGGSDAPVERGAPLIEFYAAVARRDLQGFSAPNWHPEETLSRAQALKLFTSAAAYARFAEGELGTLSVGKRADLSGFSVDLMTAPVAEIPKGHAVLTVVDGKVVYDGR
jgi:predicted amidohydrolase YtcJ